MASIDILSNHRVHLPKPCIQLRRSHPVSCPILIHPKTSNFTRKNPIHSRFLLGSFTVFCKKKSESSSQVGEASATTKDDFVTRVLKDNPSQVEPKYRIGKKFYTLKEKEDLSRNSQLNFIELLSKRLNLKPKSKKESEEGRNETGVGDKAVYLKDILREHRGKLYVPEQMFGTALSEEEMFDRDLELLPRMSFENFQKAMRSDKVKSLTSKEDTGMPYGNRYRNFIVELKEIAGDKSLHRTKWVMRLDENESAALLEEYTGPLYETERHTTYLMGKVPEYPHPVASSVSSRIMVELGMLTVAIAVVAAVIGGFLASAVFAVTSFIFAATVFVVWPIVRPFLKIFLGLLLGILERVWDNVIDLFSDGGVFSKISEFYTFGGVSASLEMLKPIMMVLLTMVLLVRFTLSRRPKNFRKWDLWQGIDFSRSKAEARVDGSTGVKFSDVAGIDEAVEELQELVRYLKNPELFDKMGIKPPHGVLLEGPPGCGKTLVAKAIAGEAGVPFYQMAGSEFVEVLVGVGSARIRDLFMRAKVNKPSVIFIDEIDALATRRQGIFKESTDYLYNAATQERETTLNQLLIELDGFDTGKGVIFLAATNRRDLLDPALLRPGRFDRKIRIRPPNSKGRLDILKIHASKVKMSETVDLSICAQNLPGWTGARLAQLVQEAALVAVRKGHQSILQSDVDDAVDRLTVGPKRVGIELGHQGQCRRATTEVGVAMTSHLLRRYDNAKVEFCDRISIVPRGQTLSQLVFHRLDDESYIFERQPQLLHRLQVLLGGRAAEEVIYGRDTSRASVSYLADASWLARKILTIWNLENPMVIHGEPPPWKKSVKFVGPRLDFEGSLYDDYGLIEPPVNFNLDDQIAQRTEELIRNMYERTVSLLRRHHAALLKAVKVLLEQKEISGEELDFILSKYPPQTPISNLLEEENPGSLPFVKQERKLELEYAARLTTSQGETRSVSQDAGRIQSPPSSSSSAKSILGFQRTTEIPHIPPPSQRRRRRRKLKPRTLFSNGGARCKSISGFHVLRNLSFHVLSMEIASTLITVVSSQPFLVASTVTALSLLFAGFAVRSVRFPNLKTPQSDGRDSAASPKKVCNCVCSCNSGLVAPDSATTGVPYVNGGTAQMVEKASSVAVADRLSGASMMEQLVPEITTHALSYLDYPSLCRLSMTNSLMRKAANDDNAWKVLYHKDFTLEQDSVTPANGWKAYYAATRAIVRNNAEFFNIIKERSVAAMSHFWLNADYVKCVHPSGELFSGYNAVIQSWQLAFNWEHGVNFQVRDVRARVLTDMAWVTMKTIVDIDAGPFNVTNVFELHNGRWYMVHHHSSMEVDGQIVHA